MMRPTAGLGVLVVAALTAGGLWQLVVTATRAQAATLLFVGAARVFVGVVGVRSRRWATSPYMR